MNWAFCSDCLKFCACAYHQTQISHFYALLESKHSLVNQVVFHNASSLFSLCIHHFHRNFWGKPSHNWIDDLYWVYVASSHTSVWLNRLSDKSPATFWWAKVDSHWTDLYMKSWLWIQSLIRWGFYKIIALKVRWFWLHLRFCLINFNSSLRNTLR